MRVKASIRLADAQQQLPQGCQLPLVAADGCTVPVDGKGTAVFSNLQLQARSGRMQLSGAQQQQQQPALLLCFEASEVPTVPVQGSVVQPVVAPVSCHFSFIDAHNLSEEEAAVKTQMNELQQQLNTSLLKKAADEAQQQTATVQKEDVRQEFTTATGVIVNSLPLLAAPDVSLGTNGCFTLQELESLNEVAACNSRSPPELPYAVPFRVQPEAARLQQQQQQQQQQGSRVFGQLSQLLHVDGNIRNAAAYAAALSAFFKSDLATMAVENKAAADKCLVDAPSITKRWNLDVLRHPTYANRRGPGRLPHQAGAAAGQPPAGNPRRAADIVAVRSDLLPAALRGVERVLLQEVFGGLLLLDTRAAAQAYEERYGAACPRMLTLDGFFFKGAGRDASIDRRLGPCSMGVLSPQHAQAALQHAQQYEQLSSAFDLAITSTKKLQELQEELAKLQTSLGGLEEEQQQLQEELATLKAQLAQLQADKQQQQQQQAEHAGAVPNTSPGASRKRPASARAAEHVADAFAAADRTATRQSQGRKQQQPQRFTHRAQQEQQQTPTRGAAARRKASDQPPAAPRKKPKGG
jgi:hypothetical protein